jgi:Asp-tRNA(Asn)/Glu-tRNA(Gln) amidotransferase A subunit family amidase
MKVMISQPMRGKTTEQIKQEREELVKQLEAEGHEVVDTIFAEEAPKDCDTAIYYLSKSIEAIGKADGIVFMPSWEEARGCRIEYQVAGTYGKFIKLL